jgi:cytochrome b subunit of formate dehydrogenase
MFGLFVTHLFDLNRKRKQDYGGSLVKLLLGPDSMLLGKRDLLEFVGSLKWFVGAGPRPHYGRWTYWEKFDYFAVFWGVAIIGATGLMLWFPEFFTRFLPGPLLNVATIIHSDEALLAVGFIFTIHFFNTHFRPGKFPMDPVIFTGSITLEELKRERPKEYEDLQAQGRLDQLMVPPPNRNFYITVHILGICALILGLTLIGLIIYAEVFRYR